MNIKHDLTKHCIKDLGLEDDRDTFRKCMRLWWHNPYSRNGLGLSLTSAGKEALEKGLQLRFYEILLDEEIIGTNQVILWMNKFMDCPYCLFPSKIFVTRETIAVQLMLFGGDLYKFGKSKQMSRDNELETHNP